jgi:hypothetical protein
MSINIFLEVLIRYFVSVLKFSIIIALLLYCIISQMNKPITQIFQVEFNTGSSYIPIFIEITFMLPEN